MRLSELFLLGYAAFSEHPDWQSFENEQDGEPVFVRDEETLSGEGLTDGEWKNSYISRRVDWKRAYCKMHVFSDSKAEAVMKGDTRSNRNDIAGQSMDIERHVCPVNTSVPILHKLQEFMSEAGLAPESFPDRIIFASMFNDIK